MREGDETTERKGAKTWTIKGFFFPGEITSTAGFAKFNAQSR